MNLSSVLFQKGISIPKYRFRECRYRGCDKIFTGNSSKNEFVLVWPTRGSYCWGISVGHQDEAFFVIHCFGTAKNSVLMNADLRYFKGGGGGGVGDAWPFLVWKLFFANVLLGSIFTDNTLTIPNLHFKYYLDFKSEK